MITPDQEKRETNSDVDRCPECDSIGNWFEGDVCGPCARKKEEDEIDDELVGGPW